METVTFVDGFGRAVQVKKDGVVTSASKGNSAKDENVMIVSGRNVYDAFGRVAKSFYPTTEGTGSKSTFNKSFDNVSPTITVYDVLDRATSVALPDNSTTTTAYTVDNSSHTLVTTVTDALHNVQTTHTNGSGKTVKTIQKSGPDGEITTSFEYDGIQRLVRVTDTEGNVTTSTYDMGDRRTEVNHPASGITSFTYFKENDDYEKMQFYYHPDHLGSSSYITNLDGEVVQHIEYVPFGEVFIEERNNIWNTPYLFNAKEFDEETGLYYYGARYYEPRLGLWISADIEQETHPNVSTYTYCLNNPILFIDPDGKGVWTKVGKAVIKVGAKVGSHGFKALTQAATYTNAFSDVLNDVNTLTDNNSSKWDKFKAGASLASELLPVSVGDIKDAYKLAKKGAKYAEREAGNLLSISKKSTKGQPKGSISGTKEALKEVKKILKMNERETLPKNKGKFGSSMRGDSKRGYRLDPAHPNAKPGSGEEYPHINYWDYTKGKRGKGGLDGAVPIRK